MPVPAWFAEILHKELNPWIALTSHQVSQLYQHFELLERWNKRMNLTAIEPGPEMVVRHYCESLFFGVHLPGDLNTVADMGSGAGFPGIPLAILRENWRITLIESNQRKAVFLREATRNLPNVSVLSYRAVEIEKTFDCLVSRAVAPKDILELIPRLGPRIGLMIGEDDISSVRFDKHIAWAEPVRLPWGVRRFCMYGEYVSRGTF